ncbi:MAG: alpha/beta fold hydrolase [Myxococcales bacterium]
MFSTSHADLRGVTLHYASAGPEQGTPVLLLHGWPDLWFTWEAQMATLAQRGFRVVAPDQRGYGASSKPPRVRDYRVETLSEDIALLIEHLELGPVHLVGHDWGGAVSAWLTIRRPDLVRSLTLVNAPHPLVFAKALLLRPSQILRSWYMFFFQIPWLADRLFELGDSALLAFMLRYGAHIDDPSLLARYREHWRRNPGSARMPLYWYRALFRNMLAADVGLLRRTIEVPALILWGTRDGAFATGTAEHSARYFRRARVQNFAAGHWPFREQPREFSQSLLTWFAEHAEPALEGPQLPPSLLLGAP